MRDDASIVPYKCFLGSRQIFRFLRGGVRAPISGLRAEPVVRLASETRLRAQRPTNNFQVGNTL